MRIAAGLALLLSVGTSACTSSNAGDVLTDATTTSAIRPADDAGKPLRTDAGMAAGHDEIAALLARDEVKAVKGGRHLSTSRTATDVTRGPGSSLRRRRPSLSHWRENPSRPLQSRRSRVNPFARRGFPMPSR